VSSKHLPAAGGGAVGALLAAPLFRACSGDRQATQHKSLKAKDAVDVSENSVGDMLKSMASSAYCLFLIFP
jgi:hypothetical protein